jgi:diadenosine tetraphosphate (Ap4A) HIT family hydrolase
MEDCLFCKIVSGEIPAHRIYEDSGHIAFLDIFPITEGQAVVITKRHHGSYQFDMPEGAYLKLMAAARKVGKRIDKTLKSKRTFMVVEGMEVPHVHVKLYPVHRVGKSMASGEMSGEEMKKWYGGHISTLHGPRAKDEDLEKTTGKINGKKRI